MDLHHSKEEVEVRRKWCATGYLREVHEDWLALFAEVEWLSSIVDKLPKTADNVPIIPGMTLYETVWPEPFHAHEILVRSHDTRRSEWMCDDGEVDSSQCYSTHEAAKAGGE